MNGQKITILGDGVDLVADSYGDHGAPPVLLLHGGGQTRHSWSATARHLGASGWHALTVDLRGHGESGWARNGNYGLDAFAGDVRTAAGSSPGYDCSTMERRQMTETTAAEWSTVPRSGTRVLVTGAAGGVGRALLAALHSVGCRTVGVDRPGTGPGSDGAERFINADLTDPADAAAAVSEGAGTIGGLDAVVSAAGVVDTIHRASSFPLPDFQQDIQINLISHFYVAQAAYPFLREATAPSIVLFSSVAGQDGLPGQASYATAKAGVLGLTRSLAAEWAGDGLRVNAVVPGLVATPKVLAMPESARRRMLSTVPLGRVATLGEIAGTVLYLLSPAAGYTTGQALRLDGGQQLNTGGLFK